MDFLNQKDKKPTTLQFPSAFDYFGNGGVALQKTSFSHKVVDVESKKDKTKKKTHPIDSSPANLILKASMDPILRLSKLMGSFPMNVDGDGVASFAWNSIPLALYLFWVTVFVGLAFYYSPMYIKFMYQDDYTEREHSYNSIYIIARYIFVSGQFVASVATMLAVPPVAKRTAGFFNKLNAIVTTLIDNGRIGDKTRRNFRKIYIRSRLGIVCWIVVVVSAWYYWWKSFHEYFRRELQAKSANYYLVIFGAIVWATIICSHVVPSFVLLSIIRSMNATFKSIRDGAERLQTNLNVHMDLDQLTLLLDLFSRLNTLVRKLGGIFGRYLIIEFISFLSTVLTNTFSTLTGIADSKISKISWENMAMSLLISYTWCFLLCEAGEAVVREQRRCLKSLKSNLLLWSCQAEDTNSNQPQIALLITSLLEDDLGGIAAANYFQVNRSLATSVTGTIVMYLIVMLQFKSSDD